MLDLKKLSQKIDAALEKETSESLTNWIMTQRGIEVEKYIGEGEYIPLEIKAEEAFIMAEEISIIVCDFAGSNTNAIQYSFAA